MSAMPTLSTHPDEVALRALGVLRFVDASTGLSVSDGLSVIARVRDREIPATPSARGVHIFHSLPGMNRVSFWDGESKLVPAPLPYDFNIEVRDASQRFFPTLFKSKFPDWPEAPIICNAAGTLQNKISLFSTPWRLPRNDFAIIRGTLREFSTDKPAAWALLRVYRKDDLLMTDTHVIEGVSGADGQFMLMFPWPKTDTPVVNGPKGPHWTMRIKAWYDAPGAQTPANELPDGENRLPALCSILKQKPAILLAATNTNTVLPLQEIIPGQPLLVKTSVIPPVTPDKKILYLKTT